MRAAGGGSGCGRRDVGRLHSATNGSGARAQTNQENAFQCQVIFARGKSNGRHAIFRLDYNLISNRFLNYMQN